MTLPLGRFLHAVLFSYAKKAWISKCFMPAAGDKRYTSDMLSILLLLLPVFIRLIAALARCGLLL